MGAGGERGGVVRLDGEDGDGGGGEEAIAEGDGHGGVVGGQLTVDPSDGRDEGVRAPFAPPCDVP
jgi:hypothetical protein